MPENIKNVLKDFILESFLPLAVDNPFDDNDSFMEKGIIDSTGILELLQFIEKRFNIKVEDEEVVPDNLDSLNKLVSFIEKKLNV